MTAIPHTHPEVRTPSLNPGVMAAILVAGHGIKHVYNAGFALLLPEIQTAFGLNNAAVGFLNTARSFAGSGSNLPAGFVADRFSNRWGRILGLLMLVIGVFQFIMGSVNGYWGILMCAVVVSAAISFWHPPAMAALSHRFPARRGFFISLHGSGGSVGEATGPLMVGALLGVMAWQGILQVSALPALVTGVAVWFLMRNVTGYETNVGSFKSYLASLRPFLTNPALLLVFFSVGGSNMAQSAVSTFLPIYLRNDLGYDPITAAGHLFLGQVAGIASAPVLGYLSDRYGRRRVLVPALLCLASGILLMSVAPPGPLLAVAIVWMGAFVYPMMALFVATAMDRVGSNVQATTVSLVFGIGSLFGSFSPTIAGFLADGFGVKAAFYWAVLAALAAAGFAALVSTRPVEQT